jgi:hypothetical protein
MLGDSRQCAKLIFQSSELGPPNPSPTGECAPLPPVLGEGHTRWRERGWESPNSDERHTLWYYFVQYLCTHVSLRTTCT